MERGAAAEGPQALLREVRGVRGVRGQPLDRREEKHRAEVTLGVSVVYTQRSEHFEERLREMPSVIVTVRWLMVFSDVCIIGRFIDLRNIRLALMF